MRGDSSDEDKGSYLNYITCEDVLGLTVSEIKVCLRRRGLTIAGRKADLAYRLQCDILGIEEEGDASHRSRKRKHDGDDNGKEASSSRKRFDMAAIEYRANVAVSLPPSTERRARAWRTSCPQKVLDRLERAMTQRFFLVDRIREEDTLQEKFVIFGSTGNLYDVTIDTMPRCSCPDGYDGRKGNTCKHLIFVLIKVLGLNPHDSQLWFQRSLTNAELAYIFKHARPAPNDPHSEHVRAAYQRVVALDKGEETKEGDRRRPIDDDTDCPICYETIDEDAEQLWWCSKGCGNALHQNCFNGWKDAARAKGQALTCPTCRSEIANAKGVAARAVPGVRNVEGYLNLADEVGIRRVRDTSTYYSGPRRGMSNWESGAIHRSYAYDLDEDDLYA